MYFASFLLYDTLPSPTLAYILAGWGTTFTQRRYRWWHDRVPIVLTNTLESARRRLQQPQRPQTTSLQSIRAGKQPSTAWRTRAVIWSEQAKKVILVELAVPWKADSETMGKGWTPSDIIFSPRASKATACAKSNV